MKIIFFIFFILISFSIFANNNNDNGVEVIELYESKSLDQMVLENLKENEDADEVVEKLKETVEIVTDEVQESQIDKTRDSFIYKNETNDLKSYFENLQKIQSKTLQKQIIKVLENLQFNLQVDKDKDIFFLVINYLQSIGQINKSYELIETFEFSEDENFVFYTEVKLNYLLSTFQLNEVCNFKEELNSNLTLNFFFLEKLDIFCLILTDNISEANLLNSILMDSEKNSDYYFQYLYSLISNSSNQISTIDENMNFKINKDLIFLYSAMIRIAELPFSKEFYELDKKNLSIPIILNQASSIDLRIRAANESFIENQITIDSLAALYMSADFNSDQLNNSEETIDRLNMLIRFWDFAKKK